MPLTFDALRHLYALDGTPVPSVTQILQASGLINFDQIPGPILLAARDRGTACHQAIHYYNEHDLDVDAFVADFPGYAPYLQAWIAFCDQRTFTPVLCEYRIASRKHGYAGTLDCLGELDGAGALLDFATGDPEDVAKNLQTAAYLAAAYEWAAEDPVLAAALQRWPVIKRYAVRLQKSGRPAITAYPDPRDHAEFLALLTARRIIDKYRGDAEAWLTGTAA